jgi:hypothetical protein
MTRPPPGSRPPQKRKGLAGGGRPEKRKEVAGEEWVHDRI